MAKTFRPEDVATHLGVSGKLVRSYLRATFPRPIEAKGTTWVLTERQAAATIKHFMARRSPIEPEPDADASNDDANAPKGEGK